MPAYRDQVLRAPAQRSNTTVRPQSTLPRRMLTRTQWTHPPHPVALPSNLRALARMSPYLNLPALFPELQTQEQQQQQQQQAEGEGNIQQQLVQVLRQAMESITAGKDGEGEESEPEMDEQWSEDEKKYMGQMNEALASGDYERINQFYTHIKNDPRFKFWTYLFAKKMDERPSAAPLFSESVAFPHPDMPRSDHYPVTLPLFPSEEPVAKKARMDI